jgi:hypothetical protein
MKNVMVVKVVVFYGHMVIFLPRILTGQDLWIKQILQFNLLVERRLFGMQFIQALWWIWPLPE